MLRKRDLHDCHALYDLMTHREVFPFVRQKAYSIEQFIFMTKQTIEAEERGELISRTILDEWDTPIGTINLFDINNKAGFLGTWLGKPFHGKGYNQIAKEAFFQQLFFDLDIEVVYMRIRKENLRSQRAAEKLPYSLNANETRPDIFKQLNETEHIYNLYEITRDNYTLHHLRTTTAVTPQHLLEA